MQTPSANGLGWDLDRAVKCHMCTQCFKALQKPKRCKGCGLARYCSRECQLQHWEQHKFPCKKRGGREGYLEALNVGFDKLASWQSGLVGGHNQSDEMIRTLTDTLAAATSIGDAEGERFLSAELADRLQEASETVGGRMMGNGETKEAVAAKVAGYRNKAAVYRARSDFIEQILSGNAPPEEPAKKPIAAAAQPLLKFDKEKDFVAAPTFSGARPGFAFQTGEHGSGYYRQGAAPAEVKEEVKEKTAPRPAFGATLAGAWSSDPKEKVKEEEVKEEVKDDPEPEPETEASPEEAAEEKEKEEEVVSSEEDAEWNDDADDRAMLEELD